MQKTWWACSLSVMMVLLLGPLDGAAQNTQATPPVVQAIHIVPAKTATTSPRDGSNLPATAQPIFYSAERAMVWLKLANKPDGRFVYGFLPALRMPMEGDNFMSQAGATFALARSARYFRSDNATAVARQAVLTLLMETAVDPKDPTIRFTAAPPRALNRLGAHGLLILAIHELANSDKSTDLLDRADQLSNYLRTQQRSDGSLLSADLSESTKAMTDHDVKVAGVALHALMRSQMRRPAPWKVDMVRKGLNAYQAHWQGKKTLTTAVSLTPAYAEAYLVTKDPAFAEAVFAMNDWLLGLQYHEDNYSSRKQWLGGFKSAWGDGSEAMAPDIRTALAAESLAEACRVARQAGDLPRLQRYERALIMSLHFVMSLQYTSARVQHFVESFRPAVLGAFYASHQDGNLRLDYTQHPLCAMVQYLDAVIE